MPVPVPPRIRFREFELDLKSGELHKEGRKVALPPKAFEVLRALVERPGEVVTREELRTHLWANDTFVEFDDNLNHVVKKLRNSLGDSAENPQYIETLPRLGYRFIGTDIGPAPTMSPVAPATALPTENRNGAKTRASSVWLGISLAAVVLLGVLIFVSVHQNRVQALSEKDVVVLADFANQTPDPIFTGTLRRGLLIEMAQSPFFNFLPAGKVNETLHLMGHNAQDSLNDDLARQVCQRNGAKAFIGGSIASLGSQYVLSLKAVNCSTGDVLVQSQTQVAKKEDIIRALSGQANLLRSKLGESLASIQKFDIALDQATTPSLGALQAYTFGVRETERIEMPSAIASFKRAIELDPDFAMAYAGLGAAYGNLEQTGLMEENTAKAYSLRTRATEAEGLRIEASYEKNALGDRYKGIEVYSLVKNLYRQEAYPYNQMGAIYRDLGQYEKALLEDQEYDRRRPSAMSVGNIVCDLLLLGRLDDAQRMLAEGETRHLDRALLLSNYYALAFFQHDFRQMEKMVEEASRDPEAERLLLPFQADTEAYYGRLRHSRDFRQQAVEACLRQGLVETAAANYAAAALQEADVGDFRAAKNLADESLKLARTRGVLAAAGIAYARSGAIQQAQEMSDELGRRYPSHTLAQLAWIPSIRASIDNVQGEAARGIDELHKAMPIDLGNTDGMMSTGLTLRTVYTRGLAYLRLHRGVEAAAEFRKILDHPGLVAPNTVAALAHLALARADVLQGDNVKARAEYEQFLNLWKDADSDIPVLLQAKAEYAELQ